MAFLTLTSLSFSDLLFVERIVSPSVEPTITLKLGSASNCAKVSGAGYTGNASTSPAINAAKAAVGSEINLNEAFSKEIASPQ